MLKPLPIDSAIAPLIEALRESNCAVLKAPAGAGKTTRVPAALIDSGLAGSGTVLVLQPRRVAARAVARRIAEERRGRVGDEIGYHIRFDRQVSRQTRLIVMTEGVLVRRLLEDPFLEGVAAVVLDEFHERHLETDLSLAMVRRVQLTVRPDLKLLVMSATLAAEPISQYLGGCPVIESHGSAFPVQMRYQEVSTDAPVARHAARGVAQMLQETTGDVLVFLPGTREIRQTLDELRDLASRRNVTVLPLYGDLPAAEQDRVFAATANREVVLATNVAETSITIPGITAVVDTGTARILEFDPNLGLNRLQLRPISRAAADQRAGRAGRTAPGICLRLWPEAAHRHRPERETAEIHRVDLSGVLLQLMDWGETDPGAFPWFDRPDSAAIEQATLLLRRLGACDPAGITPLGRQMVQLPVAPRLSRLVVAGALAGQLRRASLTAAMLSERDPFQRMERTGPARHRSYSDVLDKVDALVEYSRSGKLKFDLGTLNRGAADYVLQAADQLQRQARGVLTAAASPSTATGLLGRPGTGRVSGSAPRRRPSRAGSGHCGARSLGSSPARERSGTEWLPGTRTMSGAMDARSAVAGIRRCVPEGTGSGTVPGKTLVCRTAEGRLAGSGPVKVDRQPSDAHVLTICSSVAPPGMCGRMSVGCFAVAGRACASELESSKMPFQTDESLARDVRRTFGEYITTFTSSGGEVRADLFRRGREVVAHVSFPTGRDAGSVNDPYVSELWNYARTQRIADNFKVVLS